MALAYAARGAPACPFDRPDDPRRNPHRPRRAGAEGAPLGSRDRAPPDPQSRRRGPPRTRGSLLPRPSTASRCATRGDGPPDRSAQRAPTTPDGSGLPPPLRAALAEAHLGGVHAVPSGALGGLVTTALGPSHGRAGRHQLAHEFLLALGGEPWIGGPPTPALDDHIAPIGRLFGKHEGSTARPLPELRGGLARKRGTTCANAHESPDDKARTPLSPANGEGGIRTLDRA